MFSSILGGIGLFLLGMILMSDGLKAMAGDSLRRIIGRFAGGRFSALLSGAALTALVQSSSATTFATIGFVSAGLLTFTQAIGVIFGANLGTTSTSWIVSLLGLKLNIAAAALPLIGIGALMKLLGKGRTANAGMAVAGFGLIFVGIDFLQQGMAGLAERVDLSGFREDTIPVRLLLVLIGAVMTVLMQSSSAAVATTLTALHAGTIGIEQAAALVIGQNIGTTVKAALVSIGASTAVKRTVMAHVLFNGVTGAVAFLMLPLFIRLITGLMEGADPAVSIAAFHTGFNVLGVMIFMPWMDGFARMIERMIPERGPTLTRHLDPSVAAMASVAVETARRTTLDIAAAVLGTAADLLTGARRTEALEAELDATERALAETRKFLGRVNTAAESAQEHRLHLSLFHALDHLGRLTEDLRETRHLPRIADDAVTSRTAEEFLNGLQHVRDWLASDSNDAPAEQAETLSRGIAETRRTQREELLKLAAEGRSEPDEALAALEAMRWIDRLAYHTWRTIHHLAIKPSGEPLASEHTFQPAAQPEEV